MPQWLVVSIVLSIALTVAVNVLLRLFPGAGRGLSDALGRLAEDADRRSAERSDGSGVRSDGSRMRVIVPWKAMLIGSIVLTIALNVLLALTR
jgi:hypothetical protein